MRAFIFGLTLALSLLGFSQSAAVILPPRKILWANDPKTKWGCSSEPNAAHFFSPHTIRTAIDHGVQFWADGRIEHWAGGREFPESIHTFRDKNHRGIRGWPTGPYKKWDPRYLCNTTPWVGSYPVLDIQPNSTGVGNTRPGMFRVLISTDYEKIYDADRFAFCGLASYFESSTDEPYRMCWDTQELPTDENTPQEVIFIQD